MNIRIGHVLTAVGAGDAATLALLRDRLAPWLDDRKDDRPVVFGIRRAKVGWRRRQLALVHHGSRVRARLDELDDAADHLVSILGGIERVPAAGQVAVRARVLTNGRRAVLLSTSEIVADPDDRLLEESGITEAPTWQAEVAVATSTVSVGDRHVPLAGMVIIDPLAGATLDRHRRHLRAAATGPALEAWAELLDEQPDLIDRVEAVDGASAVITRLAVEG